jgi:uncharacterized protein YraI
MNKLLTTTAVLLATTIAAGAVPYQVGPTDLNLRAGPSPLHSSMVQMPVGSVVRVGACTARDDGLEGPPWCQVAFGRWQGWASTTGMFPVGTPVVAPPPAPIALSAVRPAPPNICSVVVPTADGWLALREGPGVGYRMITALHPGDVVWETEYTGGWVRINGVNNFVPMDGWVHGNYTSNVPCPAAVAPPPPPVVVQKLAPPVIVPSQTAPSVSAQTTNNNNITPNITINVPPPVVVNNNNNN